MRRPGSTKRSAGAGNEPGDDAGKLAKGTAEFRSSGDALVAPAGAGEGVLAEVGAGPCPRRRHRPPNVSMLAVICMVVRAYAAFLNINAAAGAGALPVASTASGT